MFNAGAGVVVAVGVVVVVGSSEVVLEDTSGAALVTLITFTRVDAHAIAGASKEITLVIEPACRPTVTDTDWEWRTPALNLQCTALAESHEVSSQLVDPDLAAKLVPTAPNATPLSDKTAPPLVGEFSIFVVFDCIKTPESNERDSESEPTKIPAVTETSLVPEIAVPGKLRRDESDNQALRWDAVPLSLAAML
eukprot:2616238-Rhodomonas_salina.2